MDRKQSYIAWQGSAWRLRVNRITLPDGQVYEQGLIEHPGSVLLIPLRPAGYGPDVLMVHQSRAALDEALLELPAGTRHETEEWMACAQRELREETGYRAQHFTPLGHIWLAPGVSNEQMHIYLATGLAYDPLVPDDDEDIEVVPMPLAKLVTMAYNGRLTDAKSVVGILRANEHLQHLLSMPGR